MVSAWQKDENAPTLVKTSTERTLLEQTFFCQHALADGSMFVYV